MHKKVFLEIINEYEKIRQKNQFILNKRKKKLYRICPRFLEIENELTNIGINISKLILSNNDNIKLNLLRDKNQSLIAEKEKILSDLHLPKNYLNIYDCSLCKDTGYVLRDGVSKMCTCFKQRIYDIAYNKSNMGNLELENFSTFDSRIFSDKVNKEIYKSDISPRQNIKLIKEKVQSFIDNFDDPAEKNLLFTGNTGIRKNFSY